MSSFIETIERASRFLRDDHIDVESAIAEFTEALKLAQQPLDKAMALRGRSLAMQYLGAQRDEIPKDEKILQTALRDAMTAAQLQPEYQDVVTSAQWHLDHKATASPGTLRWNHQKAPQLPARKKNAGPLKPLAGWMEYLEERAPMMVDAAKSDPAILDSLSFPLSVAYAWEQLKLPKEQEVVSIIALGASASSEQMVLERTNYWQEIRELLGCRRLRMWFVGPEATDFIIDTKDFTVTCHHFSAPYVLRQFLDQHPEVPATAYVCCFNAGFGNRLSSGGTGHLLHSWMPCLRRLADSTRVCIFFCANDYADAQGECFVHSQALGSRFILLPQRNPFGMASVHQNGDEWFQGNAYVYATQYHEEQRRRDIVDWATEYAAAQATGQFLPGLDHAAPILAGNALAASDSSPSCALGDESDMKTGPCNALHKEALTPGELVIGRGTATRSVDAPAVTVAFKKEENDLATNASATVRDDSATNASATVRDDSATNASATVRDDSATNASATVWNDSGGGEHLSSTPARGPNLTTTVPGGSGDGEHLSAAPGSGIEESAIPPCRGPNLATSVRRESNGGQHLSAASGSGIEESAIPPCRLKEYELFSMRSIVEIDNEELLAVFVSIEHAKSCDVTVDMSSTYLRVSAPKYRPFEFAFGTEIVPESASCKWSKKRQGLAFGAKRK